MAQTSLATVGRHHGWSELLPTPANGIGGRRLEIPLLLFQRDDLTSPADRVVFAGPRAAKRSRSRTVLNQPGDLSCGFRLHSGNDVRVLVQREGWRLVSESLADDLHGHASFEGQRRVGMTLMRSSA